MGVAGTVTREPVGNELSEDGRENEERVHGSTAVSTVDESRAGTRLVRRTAAVLREVVRSLTVGVVLLALVVVVAQLTSGRPDNAGPGTGSFVAHVAAAVTAVLLQRFADRHRRWSAFAAHMGVLAVTAALLWFFWWR